MKTFEYVDSSICFEGSAAQRSGWFDPCQVRPQPAGAASTTRKAGCRPSPASQMLTATDRKHCLSNRPFSLVVGRGGGPQPRAPCRPDVARSPAQSSGRPGEAFTSSRAAPPGEQGTPRLFHASLKQRPRRRCRCASQVGAPLLASCSATTHPRLPLPPSLFPPT
jgi:hypothetical protein